MITTIGMVELNSISQGILSSDTMLKAAEVELIFARPVCSGKYIVLVAGDVGAVKSAVAAGVEVGKNFVVDQLVIANVHSQLIPAINGSTEIGGVGALGVMEFFSISASIVAADAAAKSADVRLMDLRLGLGIGGKSFVVLSGDVSAVDSAVRSGIADAAEKGSVVSHCVIPSPSPDLFFNLV